jgi:hypothetical protein
MLFRDTTGAYGGGGAAPAVSSGKGPTLNLGVMVVPYRTATAKVGAVTTGDVAQWLEHRYGIMETYARVRGKVIENALADSVEGALEALITGRRVSPFARGMSAIQSDFKRWISSGAAERAGIPGTPTGAAMRGVSHRLAHPYRRSNPRRVSFRDTGTYMSSFAAWVS